MFQSKIIPASLCFMLCICSCQNDAGEQGDEKRTGLVRAVEAAHHKADFLGSETVSFDVALSWQGKKALEARVLQRTDGTRIRVRKQDGSNIVFDGTDGWLSGPETNADAARFDLFTWHYFFCMPWKLSDPGTRWQPLPDRVLEGYPCRAERLTFDAGTGDAPDDWYLVFSDKQSGLLRGAVYIVTYGGKDTESAGKNPHFIMYSDFRPEEGIPIAHVWTFYDWNTDSLDNKKMIGSAVISNIRFAAEQEDDFSAPAGARRI